MRVWDIDPGFLNTNSLLGEHREVHAIYTILTQGKKGYSRHPETLRWKGRIPALTARHDLLAAEMSLRGFHHKSPLPGAPMPFVWPDRAIDPPGRQFDILSEKYAEKPGGRIPLPRNCPALWAAHKYSVMARDPSWGKAVGKKVAQKQIAFEELSRLLALSLRTAPAKGRLMNALLHMWGYITEKPAQNAINLTPARLIHTIQARATEEKITYLCHATALGELAFWSRIITGKGDKHDRSDHT